ncbi:periplasmic component [Paenibacillus popilliae ATCC 14706]|uniref:Periplasmic component n=2 Tax=Paenibacillus popilliae TaxID=78057 RepID=M9LG54_PAEPP|nr:periplasmic component [Paenibacillus popilliae ATCC 14706]
MYSNKEDFYKDYGSLFTAAKHLNIEFDVISTVKGRGELEYEEIHKLIEKHQPDVLLLDEKLLASYAQEGKLYSLDEMIAEEKFDIAGYMPGVIDNLRARGNGTLYGLAPRFTVPVLCYNRDVFEENHIELPRNKMSWQELFDLSKRFEGMGSGENRVFGLDQPFWFLDNALQYIASSFSLSMFDMKAEKLLLNSDGWKRAVTLTTDVIRSKTVSLPLVESKGEPTALNDDPFFTGKAAMTIAEPWFIAYNNMDIGGKKLNWDMVTLPVNPGNPDESPHVRLEEIYAISATSQNKRAAWEFIKFANGVEMAKVFSRSVSGSLPTRGQFIKEFGGKSAEPFYMLKPSSQISFLWNRRDVPEEFNSSFTPLLTDALEAIIANKKTVDEALAELEVKGQDALVKARAAKKKEESSRTKAATGS